MRRLAPALGLMLLATATAHADYYDGLRAFDDGEYATAAKEWLVAARSGHAKAQYRLGSLYETGLSVPQSFVHAHLWYNRAAARGHAPARAARDRLAERMTEAQLAQAQSLAIRRTPAAVRVKRPSAAAEIARGRRDRNRPPAPPAVQGSSPGDRPRRNAGAAPAHRIMANPSPGRKRSPARRCRSAPITASGAASPMAIPAPCAIATTPSSWRFATAAALDMPSAASRTAP